MRLKSIGVYTPSNGGWEYIGTVSQICYVQIIFLKNETLYRNSGDTDWWDALVYMVVVRDVLKVNMVKVS